VAGRRLDYRFRNQAGSRPTLVFLHEGLGSIELWRAFPDAVADETDHQCLVYSRLGHGWSQAADSPRPLDFVNREGLNVLPALLDRLDVHQPILVGHSDGASIALAHAAQHRVRALVLLAPHVFVEEQGLVEIKALSQQPARARLIEKMSKYHRDPKATFSAWSEVWLDPEFRSWSIENVLGQIECPVLTIQGFNDPYGTMAQIDAIERQVPGHVERLEFEECGHSPHLSQPERTQDGVVRFVREVCGDI
jgi:pimeloyl-ACP methyl ester carboxylesterase